MCRVSYTDRYVTVRGLRLHYIDYQGDGPVIVALPGFIQNAHAFDGVARVLIPHFRLLALDLRGRGESDWAPGSTYRYAEYFIDLREFLAALGLSRVGLIGTSMGGVLARLYATAHPLRVTHLVLNDCLIGADMAGLYRIATRSSRAPETFADFTQAMSWFLSERNGLERLDEESRESWVRHFFRPTPAGRLRFKCDPVLVKLANRYGQGLATAAAEARSSRQEVQWQQVKRLTMPVLLLRGALSEVVLPEAIARFMHTVRSFRYVEIPGVGHCPTLYEPEAQRALGEFFGITSGYSPACLSPGPSSEQTVNSGHEMTYAG